LNNGFIINIQTYSPVTIIVFHAVSDEPGIPTQGHLGTALSWLFSSSVPLLFIQKKYKQNPRGSTKVKSIRQAIDADFVKIPMPMPMPLSMPMKMRMRMELAMGMGMGIWVAKGIVGNAPSSSLSPCGFWLPLCCAVRLDVQQITKCC